MMKRETLRNYRRTIGKFDHHTSVEMERQLIDSHLEALDRLDELTAESRCDYDCDRCREDDEERSGEYHDPHGFLTLPPHGEER